MDEPVHALTGYSIVKTGDLRLVEDHPPFLEIWMGYPLSLDNKLPQPEEIRGWELRERRTFGNDAAWMLPPIDRWLFPTRIPITFFMVLLCALVYRWTSDKASEVAGLICAALAACDPNIIAHAGLATLDVGVAVLSFGALFALYRVLKNTSIWNVCCGGFVLGVALASKISALPLLPIAGIWMLTQILRGEWTVKEGIKWSTLYMTSALLTVWACHLFQVEKSPQFPWLIPAPTYWDSIRRISLHIITDNRFSFLLGRTYRGGVWSFFPVTFFLKTPETVLILLCVGLLCLPHVWRSQKLNLIYLGLYPLIYLTVSLTGALNLGYRHLLPVMPYVYVLLGIIFAVLVKTKWLKNLFFIAVIWQIICAFITWPHFIPYFNLFAGGPSKGYMYLADSNVDWGQGLKAVKKYLEDHEIERPFISAFTPFLDPSKSYGIQADLLPPQRGADTPLVLPQRYNPIPGDYILSASTLRGLQVADPEMFNWFWHQEPQAVIAGAMLHYHVDEVIPQWLWVAQCSLPVVPLTDQVISERFGINNERIVSFDCSQSWVYPTGNPEAGWYVLHSEVDRNDDFINRMMEYTNIIYIQATPRDTPMHAVYTMVPPVYSPPLVENMHATWSQTQIRESVSDSPNLLLPVKIGNLLLTGVEVRAHDDIVELWTKWQVNDSIQIPISLMAHAINQEDQVIAVGDGFGVPFHLLQPNDVFVQRHILYIDTEEHNDMWVQTGVYRLDTLERYAVRIDSKIVGDRILIPVTNIDKH